jgi:hypothetical protein
MQTQLFSLRLLSYDELLQRVNDMARRERGVSASLVAHLSELDKRKLYRPEGFSSMFTYCVRVLRFSEQEAYGRIKAARVAARFPVVLDRLADGSLNLTSVVLLSPHLTGDNHEELFAQAKHRTRREIERLLAALRPLPPVPTIIRKLPAAVAHRASNIGDRIPDAGATFPLLPPAEIPIPASTPTAGVAGSMSPNVHTGNLSLATAAAPAPTLPPPSRPAVIVPLAPDLYKLQVTISGGTERRLRQAQELMRHRLPDGNPAEILDRALELLVEKLQKQKFGGTGRRRRVKETGAAS